MTTDRLSSGGGVAVAVAVRPGRPLRRGGAPAPGAEHPGLTLTWDEDTAVRYLRDPRLAITDTGVVCLVCGASCRHLTNTHLRKHGLTSDAYKERFGYNVRRALMIAPVRRRHSDNAVKMGLAARIRRFPILDGVDLRRLGGRHRHALEDNLARRESVRRRRPVTAPRDERGRFSTLHPREAGR